MLILVCLIVQGKFIPSSRGRNREKSKSLSSTLRDSGARLAVLKDQMEWDVVSADQRFKSDGGRNRKPVEGAEQ